MATSANTSSATDSGESVSMAVVRAVSSVADEPILDLPPLYDSVDPEALDTLFAEGGLLGRVEFRYAGYVVSVDADRTIEVTRAD